MGDEEDTYCRLCAEETPLEQLITPAEDVALSSKISMKLLWINVDITTNSTLPNTICFSCFDLLERTFNFLHNVRSAQTKLCSIYEKKLLGENGVFSSQTVAEIVKDAGKPVDKSWEEFQTAKTEVKLDPEANLDLIPTIDPNSLINLQLPIKTEQDSDVDFHDGFNSTDSDMPLKCPVKKQQKVKKRKKIKFDPEITTEDLKTEAEIEALPLSMSWEDYICHCASCDAMCKNISSLRLHSLQIHSHCCIFKCSDCGKVIASFKAFVSHVRTHKYILKHCCEYCNKQFAVNSELKNHLHTNHKDDCLMTCQNCGAYFENEELLQDHTYLYSKTTKRIRKKELLDNLKCDMCDKEFKSRSNLQQHKLVHTRRSRDFSCHVCGKMFFTKGTLCTHMSTHEDTKPFKCEFCPMTFRARGNLMSHISLHSGAKPFVCEACGKSFRVKRHLKSHSIVHTDLMPYICEYCNKSFRFKTRLNLHLRQHTGAKPYSCEYCRRDFTNGSNFKKHMKRRHNVDTSKKRYTNIVADDQNNDPVESI